MAKTQHTYLKTHRIAGKMISFDTAGEEPKLRQQAARAKTGHAAKTLVKEGRIRVTLAALRRGAKLGAHRHVRGEVALHVLRGQLQVRADRHTIRAGKGSVTVLQAGAPHAAEALRDSTVLITASMR
jgi:quercetin dioxygenase-like cupin family protein